MFDLIDTFGDIFLSLRVYSSVSIAVFIRELAFVGLAVCPAVDFGLSSTFVCSLIGYCCSCKTRAFSHRLCVILCFIILSSLIFLLSFIVFFLFDCLCLPFYCSSRGWLGLICDFYLLKFFLLFFLENRFSRVVFLPFV